MSFENTTENKQIKRYDIVKLLSVLKNNDKKIKIKCLSSLTEKDGITGAELLKKLENGEWHILYKK